MRDALEEHLATRLGTLGETVGDDLPPPADLELQVLRRRRRARNTRRWSGLTIAAAVVVVATSVAVVHESSGRGSIRIESSSSTAPAPPRDALQPRTAILSARGQYVLSLDASGHQNATMVTVAPSDIITYARATDDHRELWYLSLKHGTKTCGDVVRADIDRGNSSTIVTHAVAFDVSPDGSRVALYGAGDLARGRCSPVKPGSPGRIVVLDFANASSSAITMSNVTSLRWSPDSSYLVAASCPTSACDAFRRIGVPDQLGATLAASPLDLDATAASSLLNERFEFGPDGLYVLAVSAAGGARPSDRHVESIYRYNDRTLDSPTLVFAGAGEWDVSQAIPTSAGTYVVATPVPATKPKPPTKVISGLYRIVRGKLMFVRSLDAPGNLTPVAPLTPGAG